MTNYGASHSFLALHLGTTGFGNTESGSGSSRETDRGAAPERRAGLRNANDPIGDHLILV
jgi:hypothetical protein